MALVMEGGMGKLLLVARLGKGKPGTHLVRKHLMTS